MRKRSKKAKYAAAALILSGVAAVSAQAPHQEREIVAPQEIEHAAVVAVDLMETQEERAVQLYTDADAKALAQMAWGECRGVGDLVTADGRTITGTCQKAATMWVALNRYDAGFEESIVDVVAAPAQFAGYDPEHPLDEELLALAYDVLERWCAEQRGGTDVGRIIPADYFWFVGDGKHNHFSNRYRSGVYYTWQLSDAYVVTERDKTSEE